MEAVTLHPYIHGKSAFWLVLGDTGTETALLPAERTELLTGRLWRSWHVFPGLSPSGDKDISLALGNQKEHRHPTGGKQELDRERRQPERLHGRELLSGKG